ncbi:MASE1 domain-containing protein [Dyella sp.]|uniref:MASE1 domain-containing protein n=1 Tax=Dyella sp. TaxID=1869338 RepID=UPI002ED1F869
MWLRHAAVAIGYAVGYMALRQLSWSHWVLFAGFRLSVLLLIPYRYWPALVVGELVPVGYTGLIHADDYGALWAAVMMVPPIALAMPLVKVCRDRLGMLPRHGQARMSVMLGCAMAASTLWTLANAAALAVAVVPAGTPPYDYKVQCARWLLGNYLGILTLVPLVLMIRPAWSRRAAAWRLTLVSALRSRLLLETCVFLVPLLALLVWIGLDAGEGSRQIARMLMFLPVIGLALRHGWHGAAVGGTAASIVVAFTMPERYDATTLQAELFVAFAVSTMLLFGSQLTALSHNGAQRLLRADQALDLARRIHWQHETRLRRTARAIESINDSVQATEEALFERFGDLRPDEDTEELRQRAGETREKLTELAQGLQPPNLDRHGLVATLRYGNLAHALDSYGIGYVCRGHGKIGELSKALQLDVHRLVCEVISEQCNNFSVTDMAVRIRSGQVMGRRWVVVRVDARHSSQEDLRIMGSHLLSRLAVTGLDVEAIRDRAALYEGNVRYRRLGDGERVSIMLHEAVASPARRMAPGAGAITDLVSVR